MVETDGSYLFRFYCFGSFKVVKAGLAAPLGIGCNQKEWTLLKYLVSHKGAPVSTQCILDIFWPNRRNPDDTTALRSALYRLKKILQLPKNTPQSPDLVIFRKDICRLNVDGFIWSDIIEFEKQCALAYQTGMRDRRAGVGLYLAALELYQGDFLAEDLFLEWSGLPREHYRRLFLDSTREAAAWLIELTEYQPARRIIEQALAREPHVEELHYLLLQVCIKLGETKKALKHYSYCINLLHKELGASPSEGLKQVYQMLHQKRKTCDIFMPFQGGSRQPERLSGPMVCEPEFFYNLMLFEKRRLFRNASEASLVVWEVKSSLGSNEWARIKAFQILEQILHNTLRSSDLICCFDNRHWATFLPGTSQIGSETVIQNIKNSFDKLIPQAQVTLRVNLKINPLHHKKTDFFLLASFIDPKPITSLELQFDV